MSKIGIFVDAKYETLFGKESLYVLRENNRVVLVPVLNSDKAFCGKY